MTPLAAAAVYLAMVAAWLLLRSPYWFVAWQKPVARSGRGAQETLLRGIAFVGLFAIPFVEAMSLIPIGGAFVLPVCRWLAGWIAFADRGLGPLDGWVGLLLALASLALFQVAHRALGAGWSPTLETRTDHVLVRSGIYASIRHPIYSAFFLWALAQAFLIANWVAGLSGLVGFAILFLVRVPREERMMLDTFGDEYRAYMRRTKRLVPGLF
jgi:protein-S-isoprenylcysteine O-methyltransferase Ste14